MTGSGPSDEAAGAGHAYAEAAGGYDEAKMPEMYESGATNEDPSYEGLRPPAAQEVTSESTELGNDAYQNDEFVNDQEGTDPTLLCAGTMQGGVCITNR